MQRKEYLKRFLELTEEMYAVTVSKNSDYANEDNPFQNFELCEKLGTCSTEEGFVVRMGDKLQRVSNLLNRENKVLDEKVTDTLLDLANYSILLKIYLECKTS